MVTLEPRITNVLRGNFFTSYGRFASIFLFGFFSQWEKDNNCAKTMKIAFPVTILATLCQLSFSVSSQINSWMVEHVLPVKSLTPKYCIHYRTMSSISIFHSGTNPVPVSSKIFSTNWVQSKCPSQILCVKFGMVKCIPSTFLVLGSRSRYLMEL